MSSEQMRALLAQQQAALASLQTKLDELSINNKSSVPDLTTAAVTELLAKPKLASWMRPCGDALGDCVRAMERLVAPPVGRAGGGGDHGDRLAYRMWSMLVEVQRAKFADPAALSASQATNPLDGLAWQDARNQGGDNFTYKGIKFTTRGRVLHRRTVEGRWVLETAVASQPCKRCLHMGLNAEPARHWHYQCLNWSSNPGTGSWGWAPGSSGVKPGDWVGHVVGVPGTMSTGRFHVAALARTAARTGVRPNDAAAVAMHSWASKTTRRYHGSLFPVAAFEDKHALPIGPSACLSENLSAKVSTGVARSTLRNMVSAVCGAEDLGLLHPPSSPSVGDWPREDNRRGASPLSVPPRWPSWVIRRAPVSNVLRRGSGALAARSCCEYPRRPPLRRATFKEPAWPPSSLQKWGAREKRSVLWAVA